MEEIAEERFVVSKSVVAGLAVALDGALDAYAALDRGVAATHLSSEGFLLYA